MNEFLKLNMNLILAANSNIVKSRFCLFLKEMLPYLFRNEKGFTESLKFLFESLVDFKNKIVSYQVNKIFLISKALDCLDIITDEKNQYQRVEPLIFDILIYIERLIADCNEEPYFDFIIRFMM